MISQFDQHKSVVEYGLSKMERKVAFIERKSDITEKQKIEIGTTLEHIKATRAMMAMVNTAVNQAMGKLPPQDTELESVILGAILIEDRARRVMNYLLPSHFYSEANKVIYEACIHLRDDKIEIDIRTVVAHLRKTGKLEILPSREHYIAEMTAAISSAANIDYHARVIVEMAIKRELILYAGQVLHDAYSDSSDCFELLDRCKKQIAEIERINVKKG